MDRARREYLSYVRRRGLKEYNEQARSHQIAPDRTRSHQIASDRIRSHQSILYTVRSHLILPDPTRSHKVHPIPPDPNRSQQIPLDRARPHPIPPDPVDPLPFTGPSGSRDPFTGSRGPTPLYRTSRSFIVSIRALRSIPCVTHPTSRDHKSCADSAIRLLHIVHVGLQQAAHPIPPGADPTMCRSHHMRIPPPQAASERILETMADVAKLAQAEIRSNGPSVRSVLQIPPQIPRKSCPCPRSRFRSHARSHSESRQRSS